MKLEVNDREIQTEKTDLTGLLAQLGFDGKPVMIELNGTVIYPRDFPSTKISEGDKIVLVRMMAGGI